MSINVFEERIKVLKELRASKIAEVNKLKGVSDGFRVTTLLSEISDVSNMAEIALINQLNIDIATLTKLIDEAEHALLSIPKSDEIEFGSTFKFKLNSGMEGTVTLIEKRSERFPSKKFITMDSPLGKAVLGKKEGDNFSYDCPNGVARGTILEILTPENVVRPEPEGEKVKTKK